MKAKLPVIACILALVYSCTGEELSQGTYGTSLTDFRVLSGGKEYHPIDTTGGEITVFLPGGTDVSKIVAEFSHNARSVTVKGAEQVSGETVNDFTDYKKGVVYLLDSGDGNSRKYTVRVLATKLPVVSIVTTTPGAIRDKVNWRDATLRIGNTDGTFTELGHTGIRGRGNWTWEKYPKKPYALKLDSKKAVLGMPAHKRWVLLALYRGFIGNALMFEATRRAPALGWAPRGCFVELVLNGEFMGMYYLCEQIKIDKNRVDISELETTDVNYPEVSGGYLLEYDELYDEDYKFKSSGFNLPVQLKSPDDDVPDQQFGYIKGFINDMEAEILKIGSGEESHYRDYMDIDTFAEYWMVLETVGNYEAYKPRSVKMYKGRDGVDSPAGTVSKLKAGPLWDQELFQVEKQFNSKDMYYYKYLFRDPVFVETVKSRWPAYRDNILGNDTYVGFVQYLTDMVNLIRESANRDTKLWGNEYFTLSGEVSPVKTRFVSKINWMDSQISGL
ncbi:MAG: CotH kinase family protein [Bacteroidales bacterium]|nr:CotH kinase family protein [Bacteroidales bacterium]